MFIIPVSSCGRMWQWKTDFQVHSLNFMRMIDVVSFRIQRVSMIVPVAATAKPDRTMTSRLVPAFRAGS